MALQVLQAYNLQGLQAHLANVEGPAVLVVHGVASLSEALEVYALADAASRDRGWQVAALPNLTRLGGVATEIDRLSTTILPRLVADPSRKADLLLLRHLAFSVRHQVRRLDCAGFMRLRVVPVTNRLVRMVRRVISGQAEPASLAELLPAAADELGIVMRAYYIPVEQGPSARIDVHSLDGLTTSLLTTDGRAEVVVHAVASLAEALGMYSTATAAIRDRGWTITGLPDLARLAALGVEVDRLTGDLLHRVFVADDPPMADLFQLKNSASTVRHLAHRVESAGEFRLHLDPLMDRIIGAVKRVTTGRAPATLLADVLPAARDELNLCKSTYYISLP